MSRRQNIWIIAVLIVIAIIVQMLVMKFKPAPATLSEVGPQRSGYTITDLTYYGYADDGHLNIRIISPYLERRENDQSYYLTSPDFLLPSDTPKTTAPWYGTSEFAWISHDNSEARLLGKVDMHQDAYQDNPDAEIHSTDVSLWPNDNKVASKKFTTMRQGKTHLQGTGFRANLATNYMELLNDFKGTYVPTRHH